MADLWFHPAHRNTKEMADKLHPKHEQFLKDIITVSTSTIKNIHKVIGIGLLPKSPSQEKVLMSSSALLNLLKEKSSYPSTNTETTPTSPTTKTRKRKQSTSFLS
jgi:hypothetical protein